MLGAWRYGRVMYTWEVFYVPPKYDVLSHYIFHHYTDIFIDQLSVSGAIHSTLHTLLITTAVYLYHIQLWPRTHDKHATQDKLITFHLRQKSSPHLTFSHVLIEKQSGRKYTLIRKRMFVHQGLSRNYTWHIMNLVLYILIMWHNSCELYNTYMCINAISTQHLRCHL